jgi:hypothetical protein
MSLETGGGSAEVSESVAADSTPAPSESKSEYSVTDPGYGSGDAGDGPTLEDLIAENKTENTPSSTEDDASEADGDTEETGETPADESATPDGFSDELLDRATELGYTLDEIKGFRSEKSLQKEITRVETLQKRLQERQAKPEPAPIEEATPEPDWAALVEEGHDPATIDLLKANHQRTVAAEALVRQMYQAEQSRALTAQSERFDDTLNKMEGFGKILGSGRKGDLTKASPEHVANRQKVFTTMQILKRGFEEAGVKVPSEEKLIKAAAMASFPDHTEQIARTQLKSDIKKAGSQALSRPNSAGAKPLSGAPAAAAKEDAFWKKFR